jgi:hypothetical protein
MANPEHFGVIKKGTAAWNQWRQDPDAYRQSLEWLLGDLKIQNR